MAEFVRKREARRTAKLVPVHARDGCFCVGQLSKDLVRGFFSEVCQRGGLLPQADDV